ncbi:MAG: hypothetical protein JJU11_04905 [Candidatus Sumerlaeia bacterium]|nr:hypothetical protein [Candidatus Sumerlaeia bacterium]
MFLRRTMKMALVAGLLAGALAISPDDAPAQGTIEPLLQYQGVLRDSDGRLINEEVKLTFRLYQEEDPEGIDPIWEETHTTTIKEGLVAVVLGSETKLDTRFFQTGGLWLGINVNDDDMLSPLQRLLPSATALFADTAGNAQALDGRPQSDFALQTDISNFVTENDLEDYVTQVEVDGFARLDEVQTFTSRQSIVPGSGPALTTSGSIEVTDGSIKADSFQYNEPQTRTIRLMGQSFFPFLDSTSRSVALDGTVSVVAETGSGPRASSLVAPVDLPVGARATEIRAQFDDQDPDNSLRLRLVYASDGLAGVITITTLSVTSEEVTGLGWATTTPQTPHTITGSRYYMLRADGLDSAWAESGNSLRLRLVEIDYVINELN